MIANLTRLRQLPGGGLGTAIIAEGAFLPLPRHDQDALNHFLKPKPHLLLELSSRWNFLPSSCMAEVQVCPDCISAGILALHGADMTFFRYVDVKFKMMYATLLKLSFDEAPSALLASIQAQLNLLDTGRLIFPCSNYTGFNQALTYGLTHL
ncbi:uncharacterized protein LOC134766717 [Penaeus indicus]|uniref:uncharacterized protein LOC134766717 n=1 Tax=Penaeus indicus TaxID=29960 RepID=UPI00300D5087